MYRLRKITPIFILAIILPGSLITSGCNPNWNPVRNLEYDTDFQYTPKGSETGNLAPEFQLNDLNGQPVSLSDFRNRPVLLNFWASWCPPCRDEIPFIQDISVSEKWAEETLVVLAIDIGESVSTVREFANENGLTFTILLDIKMDVALEYHILGIPSTFFINREGMIRDYKIGPFSEVAEIERSLEKIMH